VSHRPPRRFTCDAAAEDGRIRVTVVGELDLATVAQLQHTVDTHRQAGATDIVLDLRALSFIDSTGLRLILDLDRAARSRALRFSLIAGPPEVQRIFEITGTVELLNFEPDPELSENSRRPRNLDGS
jgi:anti-sigma B factor antagonist